MDALDLFFGKKRRTRRTRRTKRSPGRRPKRGHYVKSLPKSRAYVTVKGRKRKLYRGKNGGLFYRTKSGRNYVSSAVLKRRRHMLSPKRRRVRRAVKKLRRRRRRKLKMTKKAIAARRAYRKRMRRGRFGDY